MKCDHCGRNVPKAPFCTACGAHQAHGTDVTARHREHGFAAHPGEHVAHPAFFTTLLPHLPHVKVHEFRYAFFAGAAIVGILMVAGLVSAALLAAIVLVPVLYLLYLYEAEVYRDEPLRVLGLTVGGGVVLGVALTLAGQALAGYTKDADQNGFLLTAIIIPLVQILVLPIPALFLRRTHRETIDGLVFGVAAGMGFSLAEGVVRFAQLLPILGVRVEGGAWIYTLITVAVLIPLLHGSTAGAITAGLWRQERGGHAGWLKIAAIPGAAVTAVAFYAGGQLVAAQTSSILVGIAYQVFVVGVLLVYIRYLLHHALLEEAQDVGFRPVVCTHCHSHVIAAGFCPHCGISLAARPRRTRRRPAAETAEAS